MPIAVHWDVKHQAKQTNYCEIFSSFQFLPVYNPSKEEVEDPKLFANNVRDVMAR